MKLNEVLSLLHEQQKDLVDRYHIAYLSLFGSVVKGEARSGKKVGILVKFAQPTGFFQFLDLKRHLETLLGCEVDIGKPCSLRPQVRTRVLQEAVRVF